MKPLKVGIMSFAHLHAVGYINVLRATKNVEYIGFADDDLERARTNAVEFDSPLFESYDALLAAKPDAVIICSENTKHRELVEMAAAAGVHVLCEKPIATTIKDAKAMIDACAKANVNFMIAFPMRFSAPAQQVKATLDRNDMGAIRCANTTNQGRNPDNVRAWFTDKTLAGGGAVMDHTVHVVDLMRWYMGAEVIEVFAEVDNLFYKDTHDIDTAGLISMTFDNGVFMTLDCSWSRPRFYPIWGNVKVDLICERGVLRTDYFTQKIDVYEGKTQRPVWHGWGSNPDKEMIDEFLSSIWEERQPLITGEDGLAALKVVMAAYESGKTHQVMKL